MANILSLRIRWPSYGLNKTYNIYYKRIDEGDFEKANAVPLLDNSDGNLFVISQIAPGTEYLIYVVECINNIDVPQCVINRTTSFPILNKVKIKTYS